MFEKIFEPRFNRSYNNLFGGIVPFTVAKSEPKEKEDETNSKVIKPSLIPNSQREDQNSKSKKLEDKLDISDFTKPTPNSNTSTPIMNTSKSERYLYDAGVSNIRYFNFAFDFNAEQSITSLQSESLKANTVQIQQPNLDSEYSLKFQLLQSFLPKDDSFSYGNFVFGGTNRLKFGINTFEPGKAFTFEQIEFAKTQLKNISSKFEFSFSGTIETYDGKSLSFSMNFNMTSEFTSFKKESIAAEFMNGMAKNVNYNSTSEQIRNTQYEFSFEMSYKDSNPILTSGVINILDSDLLQAKPIDKSV